MIVTPQARPQTDPTADPITDVIPVVPPAAPWPSALRTREQAAGHRAGVGRRGTRRWPWATAGLAVGLLIGVGIGGAALGNAATATAAAPAPAPQTVTVTAPAAAPETVTVTAAAPAPVTVTKEVPVPSAGSGSSGGSSAGDLTDGVYQAGADIEAGRYKTSGGGTYGSCIWQTYTNAADSISSFVDGNASSGQMYASVAKGQYLELSGGCSWTKVS
ncbi:hypothetical protein GCM10010472_09390 [Pseudonocardia halophobica]|uniref:Uncharacterized protein n=1 Tax=Pseudonocardia halophobica TaxID=29401 RepID=A0A9W6UEX6_9PSEU|nr:hypothetical protein [Pseudonocardia halophobica]GLL15232.1 hypothetical protein GCM10017577_63810 [Pseudonocardia halophobica]